MAFTFGGNTGDDITATLPTSPLGADNGSSLVAGWWYPTTLTAGRGYWSAANVHGATVGPTTSEMRLTFDNATTDGVWDSSGAGIVTNEWQFLAWLMATENTTVAGAVRFWRGTADTPPVGVTVTNTTPRSGNYTGSASFTVGNIGTGSLSFQGDIGSIAVLAAGAVGISSPLFIGTSGAIANTQADLVYHRWVWPLWAGAALPIYNNQTTGQTFGAAFINLSVPIPEVRAFAYTANSLLVTPTVNTAVFSQAAEPRRLRSDWPTRKRAVVRP